MELYFDLKKKEDGPFWPYLLSGKKVRNVLVWRALAHPVSVVRFSHRNSLSKLISIAGRTRMTVEVRIVMEEEQEEETCRVSVHICFALTTSSLTHNPVQIMANMGGMSGIDGMGGTPGSFSGMGGSKFDPGELVSLLT